MKELNWGCLMKRTVGSLSWIEEASDKQREFFVEYFRKHIVQGLHFPTAEVRLDWLKIALQNMDLDNPDNAKAREAIAKMRASWRQEKYRSMGNKKPYSFVMGKGVEARLKMLSKEIDKPISETVEGIIMNTYDKIREQKNKDKEQAKTKTKTKKASSLLDELSKQP